MVYTATVVGYNDPTWLADNSNSEWVNTLVRENSSTATYDGNYPLSRDLDWFHEYSWAKSLFEFIDSKNGEIPPEDTLAGYALKLCGRTISDSTLGARGNPMLAIKAWSLESCLLHDSNNTFQPA